MLKSTTFRSTLGAIVCALYLSMHAMADSPRKVEIAAGNLRSALLQLSRTFCVELLYQPSQLDHFHTAGVQGDYTPDAAIRLLLKGTPLELRTDPSGAMIVIDPKAPRAAAVSALSEQGSPAPRNGAGSQSRSGLTFAQANAGQTAGSASVADRHSSSAEEEGALEGIIVTAQKRAERLIDVPISIAVVGAVELQERNIASLNDLQFAIPGLSIENSGGYYNRVEIRGISNFLGGTHPTVGMYLGEADANVLINGGDSLNLSTYDLERVEVLRGPQGTLYGEGSLGGTIRFIPSNPDLNDFQFAADVNSMFTQGGSPGNRVNAMVNVPLVSDRLGVRFAATFDREGGWIDQPAALRKDYNGRDLTDVRSTILWKLTSQLSVSAMADIHRDAGAPGNGGDADDRFTQVFGLTTGPRSENDFSLYNLTLEYGFGDVSLIDTTTYNSASEDVVGLGQLVPFVHAPGAGPSLQDFGKYINSGDNAITQEFRFTSVSSGPWLWTVGSMYQDHKESGYLELYVGASGPLPANPNGESASNGTSSAWAVFGDTNYKLADKLTLGAGLRYYRDDETGGYTYNYLSLETTPSQTATFSSTDPRIYLKFQTTENMNLYASASKGFRSGGFNSVGVPTYGPESLWTYELGEKTSWLDGRLTGNADVFSSNYKGYQVTTAVFVDGALLEPTANGGGASIKGVEWDFAWHLAEQWILTFNGDWLKTRFTEVPPIPPGSGAVNVYDVGDPLDFVPDYEVTASIKRDFNWGALLGFGRLDYSQQGKETYRDRNIGPWFFSESDTIHMLNFDASLRMNSTLSLGVFAQNLTSDRGYADPLSIQAMAARPRPRTYGLNFSVNFD
jgi:iron complex outermembrane recepter protein